MNTSALFPLNRRNFTDAVISSVIQREQHFHGSKTTSPPSHSIRAMKPAPSRLPSLPRPTSVTGHKRLLSDTLSQDTTYSKLQKTKEVSTTDDLDAIYAADVELRRQRNRMHQARYKMKQRKLVQDLENSVTNLKKEVQELELQHRFLSYKLPTDTTLWGVAAEYFCLFRHGVKGPVVKRDASLTPQNEAQWDFMQTTMAHDVTDGVVIGAQALIENLMLQSRCYEEIDLRPLRMDNGPGDSLIVTTKCELTITEGTLCYGFPNLVNNGRWSSLAGRMLGQTISIPGSMHFIWNHETGRVTRLQWKADLLTPLMRLLGSLEDVARVFKGAKLSPEGLVKPSDMQCD